MEDNESKPESQGQNSQIMAENLEGFQQCVKEIHDLIEQYENFSEMTPEIHNRKKSKLTKLETELSRIYEAFADQHVDSIKEVSKNTQNFTTPIKTQHVGCSTSTSPQTGQTSKTPEFMTPVGYKFTLHNEGGFHFSTREGSETSFTLSSDSESTYKHPNSPVNDESSKSKETKVNDPEALHKKISTLEKEVSNLKKKNQDLTDENAFLEAEKANAADLRLEVIKSNHKNEAMVNVLEASRQHVIKLDEQNTKLQNELRSKVFDLMTNTEELKVKVVELGKAEEKIEAMRLELDSKEARNRELNEEVNGYKAEISNAIEELNVKIIELTIAYAAVEDRWKTDINMLETVIGEKTKLLDDLKQKHDALRSYTNEVKAKVANLAREVMLEDN